MRRQECAVHYRTESLLDVDAAVAQRGVEPGVYLIEGGDQPFHRQRVQLGNLLRLQSQLRHQFDGHLGRKIAWRGSKLRTALDHRAMEQSLRGGHREEVRNLSSAARLPEDH